MGLFSRKLTSDEQAEIDAFIAGVTGLCFESQAAFAQLASDLQALHRACKDALLTGSPISVPQTETDRAAKAVARYRTNIEEILKQLDDNAPWDWFPKQIGERYDSLLDALETLISCANTVTEGLTKPALRRDPGLDRLNMFVSGVNVLMELQYALRPPKR